jgi:hypothetical protein
MVCIGMQQSLNSRSERNRYGITNAVMVLVLDASDKDMSNRSA